MLQDAASIADLVGAIAVVVSLIFVGVQVMQANKLAREAAEQKQIEGINMISRLIIENPQLTDVMAKAHLGEELTPADQVLLTSTTTFIERTWEQLYLQYKAGRVAPELWEAHHSQAIETYGNPAIQAIWERRKHWFSKSYREYRDAETAKAGGAYRNPYNFINPPASQPESDRQQPAPVTPKQ